MKRTPLKAGTKRLQARSRIKQVGRKKKKEIADTGPWRRAYLAKDPYCEIGVVLTLNNVQNSCTIKATCLHERKKRSQGGSLIDPANVMRSCEHCNGQVEDMGQKARDLGLVVYSHENPNEVDVSC